MSTPAEKEVINKFVGMTKDFKGKADGLIQEITSSFGSNIECAINNYKELQNSYLSGYTGITAGAQKANTQLMESFDKNFGEWKSQLTAMYGETQAKANEALDTSTKDFEAQCVEVMKKVPILPESAYKDVIKAITNSKGSLNSQMDKRYKELLDKIETNFQATRKSLTLPELKEPKLPSLDLGASGNIIKNAVSNAVKSFDQIKPSVQNMILESIQGK